MRKILVYGETNIKNIAKTVLDLYIDSNIGRIKWIIYFFRLKDFPEN